MTLQQGVEGRAVQSQVQTSLRVVAERDAQVKREVETYYATLRPDYLAQLFSERPPRKPRVRASGQS